MPPLIDRLLNSVTSPQPSPTRCILFRYEQTAHATVIELATQLMLWASLALWGNWPKRPTSCSR